MKHVELHANAIGWGKGRERLAKLGTNVVQSGRDIEPREGHGDDSDQICSYLKYSNAAQPVARKESIQQKYCPRSDADYFNCANNTGDHSTCVMRRRHDSEG